jgi:endo-1,4-beta-xylanase
MQKDDHASRRQLLVGMLGSAIAASFPVRSFAQATDQRPLKALAAEKGILFGSSVGAGQPGTLAGSFADPRYLDILKKECAVLVPENELKSYVIAAEPETFDFERADRIAGFATSHGMKLRGHTLLWNRTEYTPKWLTQSFAKLAPSAAERYLRGYIERVCTRYGERIYSWDVVNETIDPKTGRIRDTAFTQVLGSEVLRIAYEAAREYAPHAQLVYNDYMSWEAGNEQHRSGVLRLLEQFKRNGIPVDAVGIQSHLGNVDNNQSIQSRQWRAFIDEIVAMGYTLLITELDVNDRALPGDARTRDSQVAATAKEYLDVMLSYKQLDQVLCWGMVDNYSWLQNFSRRSDGLPQRPTPYDSAFNAKPLREALTAAFAAAPRRAS